MGREVGESRQVRPVRGLRLKRLGVLSVAIGVLVAGGFSAASAWFKVEPKAPAVQAAAAELVKMTPADQKEKLVIPFDAPQRLDWHFIPKDTRKGLEMNLMNAAQREATHKVLQGLLSQVGYDKAKQIIHLENVLKEVEQGSGPIRDPLRYYLTFCGAPSKDGRWGISFEGHHLSLNFVLDGGQVVSSSPQAFASNPAEMKVENKTGVPVGTRILELEESLAFELIHGLSEDQRRLAIFEEKALKELTALVTPHPPQQKPVGISANALNEDQKKLLTRLIDVYIDAVPEEVANERRRAVNDAGWDQVFFAWAGAREPGIGHYYRIQGPTFWIEFVNTQPDAMGNPANHIHCIWRDMRGDFGLTAAP